MSRTRWSAGARWTHAHHTMDRDDDPAMDQPVPYRQTKRADPRRFSRVDASQGVLTAIDEGEKRRKQS